MNINLVLMPIKIGLIGKTNTGKTTFFNAASLLSAKVSTYPFTTKSPNTGIANAVTLCVCREFQVKDNPKNSGVLFIIGSTVALASLLLIWNNVTNLTFIGGGLEDNFLPIPLGSVIVLVAGIWNLVKS